MQSYLVSPQLAFPAGQAPGFDATFLPGAASLLSRCVSCVAAPGGGAFNLLAPSSKPTITGSPSSAFDGLLGKVSLLPTSAGLEFSVGGNNNLFTTAMIFRLTTLSANSTLIVDSSNSGPFTFGSVLSCRVNGGSAGSNLSTPNLTLTVGHAYFLAQVATGPTTDTWYAVLVDLTTRTIVAGIKTSAILPNNTITTVAFNTSTTAAFSFAAGMWLSGIAVPFAQLMRWAADPWSFWYPKQFKEELFYDLVGAQPALLSRVFQPLLPQFEQPAYFAPKSIAGIFGTVVTPLLGARLRTDQERPFHPSPYTFISSSYFSILPTINRIIVSQEQPTQPLPVSKSGTQGPNVASGIGRYFIRQEYQERTAPFFWNQFFSPLAAAIAQALRTTQEAPAFQSALVRSGVQGPNVARGVGSIYTRQEQPFHPSSWGWVPPIQPVFAPPFIGSVILRQEQPWHPNSVFCNGVAVPVPNIAYSITGVAIWSSSTEVG